MAEDNEIIAKLKVEGLAQYKSDLSSASKSTDTATTAIEKMESAMAEIPKGTKEFEKLAKELEAVKSVASITSDELENNKTVLKRYTKEISDLAVAMDKLKSDGKQNTQTYRDIEKAMKETAKKAGELKDKIGDINSVIKNLGSDTRGIDNVVRGVSLMSNSYQAFLGVQSLVGKENKNLQEGLLKLNAVMAVTQSIQQIGNELTAEDSVLKQAASKATAAYNIVVGTSTGALKLFRIALAATGIGIAIVGIIALVENWDKLKNAITGASNSLDEYKKKLEDKDKLEKLQKDKNDLSIAFMKAIGRYTDEQAKKESLLYLERAKESKRLEHASQLEKQKQLNSELEKQRKILKETSTSTTSTITSQYGTTFNNNDKYITQLGKVKSAEQKLNEQIEIANLSRQSYMVSVVALSDAQEALKNKTQEVAKSTKEVKKNVEDLNAQLPLKNFFENRAVTLFDEIDTKIKETEDLLVSLYTAERKLGTSPSDNPFIVQLVKDLDKLKELRDKEQKEFNEFANIDRTRATGVASVGGEGVLTKSNKPKSFFETFFGLNRDDFQTESDYYIQVAKDFVTRLTDISNGITGVASSAIAVKAQRDIAILEDQKNKGVLSEKEYNKKAAEVKNEAARKERAVQIATATAAIPMAVLSAFIGTPGGIIAKGIAAAIAGAFAASQVAIIASTPLPKFRKGGSVAKVFKGSGYVVGRSHEQGGVNAELEGNEYVVKGKAVNKYGLNFLDSVNSLKLNPIIASNNNMQKSDNALRDNLMIMASYAKQSTRLDREGNMILKGIYQKLNSRKVYV
jgi:hypothetical protein